MKRSKGVRRDFLALKKRRRRAARLFKAEVTQAEISRILDVSRQSVSRWYKDWRRGGNKALEGAGRAGRKPRLSSSELTKIDAELRKGATAHGFGSELWTLRRVAVVIERVTGMRYHAGHVWRILRAMNWSLQRPAKRAKERNEAAVRQWISQKWPELKKKPGG